MPGIGIFRLEGGKAVENWANGYFRRLSAVDRSRYLTIRSLDSQGPQGEFLSIPGSPSSGVTVRLAAV
jgi:hypothetical protein